MIASQSLRSHIAIPQALRNASGWCYTNFRRNLGDMQAPADTRRFVEVEGGGELSTIGQSIVGASHWRSAFPLICYVGQIVPLRTIASNAGWGELAVCRKSQRVM